MTAGESADSDRLEELLERVAEVTATPEARDFHEHLGLELFAGGLLRLLPYRGSLALTRDEVEYRFDPPDFPDIVDFQPVHRAIEERLDPTARRELDSFLASRLSSDAPAGADRRSLGSNSLRTTIKYMTEEPEDHVGWVGETQIRPLTVEFGTTDWWRIQAYCNRLHDDPEFRRRALDEGWIRKGVPFNRDGRVPSFAAAHVLVTGGSQEDPYVVLTQRRGRLRYYPEYWEIGIAENHHGPRTITRNGKEQWIPGDRDFHECALRGLAEEFGVSPDEVDTLLLLGFFVEAAFGSIVAIFHAHVGLDWRNFRRRIARLSGSGTPLEANVFAREPLTTRNLVRLLFMSNFAPISDTERDFIVAGGVTDDMPFHPASKGRLLQYLLASQSDHSCATLVSELQGALPQVRESD